MASNRVTWQPSTDSDIASYALSRGTSSAGPWTSLGTVVHNTGNSAVYDATNGVFYFVDNGGTSTSWYRIIATDSLAQTSPPSIFQVGGIYPQNRTEVGICNLALSMCGAKRQITSLTATNSVEAIACGANYETVRDNILMEVPWPFATKRAVLTPLTDATTGQYQKRTGYGYMFDLPQDCLLDRFIHAGINSPLPSQRIPYAIEPADSGVSMVLLTDAMNPELVYTARVVPGLMPAYFVDALAARLALALVLPLTIQPAYANMMNGLATQKMNRAVAMSFRQGQAEVAPDSEFISFRGGA
jgi:hypothetical protein